MALLGTKMASKIDQKSIQKGIETKMQFGLGFGALLERFLVDFCNTSFHADVGIPNGKLTFFRKSSSAMAVDFCSDFGPNLLPFYLPKSTKIFQKVDPQRHQSSDRFLGRYLVDLGSDFGRQDEPKTGPSGRQDRQDGPKRSPRRPKRPPRSPQEGPEKARGTFIFRYWPPSASKDPPGPLQDRFLSNFGLIC